MLVLDPAGLPEGWGQWLLVRRPITPIPGADPELAFHPAPARPAHPAPEPIGVAGARWAVASGHGSDGLLRLVDHLRAG